MQQRGGGAFETGPDALRRIPLFKGLSNDELAALEPLLRRRRHVRGEAVFRQGDPGTSLYLIASGAMKIARQHPDGREIILALLGAGDVFGELAVLDGEPRSADAIAQEESELLSLDRDAFVRFLADRPEVALRLLITLSLRLRRTDDILQDAAFLDVGGRLARALLSLPADTEGGRMPRVRLTQGDLASLIGATRESVNRWLKEFARRGAIRFEGGRLQVIDEAALRKLL